MPAFRKISWMFLVLYSQLLLMLLPGPQFSISLLLPFPLPPLPQFWSYVSVSRGMTNQLFTIPWSGVRFRGGHVTELVSIRHKGTSSGVSTCHFHYRDQHLAQTVHFPCTTPSPPHSPHTYPVTGTSSKMNTWSKQTMPEQWNRSLLCSLRVAKLENMALGLFSPKLSTTWRGPASPWRKVQRGKLPGW